MSEIFMFERIGKMFKWFDQEVAHAISNDVEDFGRAVNKFVLELIKEVKGDKKMIYVKNNSYIKGD